MAPEAHQKKHGNDLDFPKEIKEHEISGHEQAHDAGLQKQQKEMEGAHLDCDGPPGDQDTDDVDKGREQQEQLADPIQPQTVADPQAGNPGVILSQQPNPGRPGLGLEPQK